MNRFIDTIRRQSVPVKLIAINMAVWIAVETGALCGINILYWLSVPSGWHELAMRPWTLFTYQWAHGDFWHVLFNMLWLYWFGEFFLTLHSNRQLVVLYIYGGLLGALLYCSVCPAGAILCGASGSVLAIVAATGMRMPRFKMHLMFLGGVELRWIALASVILSIMALYGSNSGGNVAHLGGVLAGVIFAAAMRYGVDITAVRMPHFHNKKGHMNDEAATLDALLDKVRHSGYNSLNSSERKKLIELSNRL